MAEEHFYYSVNMHGLEVRNHRMHLLASDPVTPNEGDLWFNVTDHVAKVRSNTATRNLFNPDDDFYNRLIAKTAIVDADELLIADSEDTYNYKRMTKANFVAGLGAVNNAYYRINVNAGDTQLDASGEDDLSIFGDGAVYQTVGAIGTVNTITLALLNQNANLVFAGPSSGGATTPTFRALTDDDMPSSYTPGSWDAAYTHSLVTSGNPHGISMTDLGFGVVTTLGDPGTDGNLATEAAIRTAITAAVVVEDLWDRDIVGTPFIHTHTAGDNLRLDSKLSVGAAAIGTEPLYVYHATQNVLALFESGNGNAGISFKDSVTVTSPQIRASGDDLEILSGAGEVEINTGGSARVLIQDTSTYVNNVLYVDAINENTASVDVTIQGHSKFNNSTTNALLNIEATNSSRLMLLDTGARTVQLDNGFYSGAYAAFRVGALGTPDTAIWAAIFATGELSVNFGIIPDANYSAYLGTSVLYWTDLYIQEIHIKDSGATNATRIYGDAAENTWFIGISGYYFFNQSGTNNIIRTYDRTKTGAFGDYSGSGLVIYEDSVLRFSANPSEIRGTRYSDVAAGGYSINIYRHRSTGTTALDNDYIGFNRAYFYNDNLTPQLTEGARVSYQVLDASDGLETVRILYHTMVNGVMTLAATFDAGSITSPGTLLVNTINEYTLNNGVIIEGTHFENNYIGVNTPMDTSYPLKVYQGANNNLILAESGDPGAYIMFRDSTTGTNPYVGAVADDLRLTAPAGVVYTDGTLEVDTIIEFTNNAGVTIESIKMEASNIFIEGAIPTTYHNDASITEYNYIWSNNPADARLDRVYRYGGTKALPIAAVGNSYVTSLSAFANDGTADREIARESLLIDGTVATDNVAGRFYWFVRPTGIAASLTKIMELNQNGLNVDNIIEDTNNAGVTIEGSLLQDGALTLGTGSLGLLTVGFGASIDTIETTLTNDATHIPTSSAVYSAILGGLSYWDRVTGTPNYLSPATSGDWIYTDGGIHFDGVDGVISADDGSASNGFSITIQAGDPVGATNDAGSVTIKAGDALAADAGSNPGGIYLMPGSPYQTSTVSQVFIGDSTYNADTVGIQSIGSQIDVDLTLSTKGDGKISLLADDISLYNLRVYDFVSDMVITTASTYDMHILGGAGSTNQPGRDILIESGQGNGTGDGGNLYMFRGPAGVSGVIGHLFFGNGSSGALSNDEAETSIVGYDTITGQLTYRSAAGISPSTFIGLSDTPADWTGGVGGYFAMVNSTPDALEFINPGAYAINNFSGTLTGNWTITGSDLNTWRVESSHAAIGSVYATFSDAGKAFNVVSWSGAAYSGGYSSIYVDDLTLSLVQEPDGPTNPKGIYITPSSMLIRDDLSGIGFQYNADYSTAGGTLGARWIPDKGYVDSVAMVYPVAGIALSTGAAWGASITNNSANWNTAFGWGDHAGLYAAVSHAATHLSTGGDTIANFSTTSLVTGLVPGSNSLGATYFLSGAGTWLVPAGGSSVTFGTTTQIPYMNAGGTDFIYSANLSYNGTTLTAATSIGTTNLSANFLGLGVAASSSYALYASHAGTPGWFERAYSGIPVAGTPYAAMSLQFTTTSADIDTGPFFYFKYEDSTAVVQNIGALGFMRDGADNTGEFKLYVYTAGSRLERLSINSAGTVSLWNSTDVSERLTIVMNVDGMASIYNYDTSPAGYKSIKLGTNVAAKGFEVDGDSGNVGINIAPDSLYSLTVEGYMLADRHYIDPTPGTSDGSGITAAALVHTNAIGIGCALYMAADGAYDSADADAAATMPVSALALDTTAHATLPRQVLLVGFLSDPSYSFSGAGAIVYASGTLGQLTTTPPSGTGDFVQAVGIATSTTSLYFNPDFAMVEIV